MKNQSFSCLFLVAAAASLAGCGSGREVAVAGQVTAGAGVSAEGPIVIDFLDVIADDEAPVSVHQATLDAPGEFSETVELEGDKVLVRAIADADGDLACSAGEAWAEFEAPIADDDSVEPISLTLANAPCPAAE